MLTYKSSRVLFRSIATIAVALTVVFSAHAQDQGTMNVQKGKAGISAFAGFGLGDVTAKTGFGGKFHYNVADNFRLSASLAGFFESQNETYLGLLDYTVKYSFRDLSLNGQYMFNVGNIQSASVHLYPLAGLGFFKAAGKVKNVESPLLSSAEEAEAEKEINEEIKEELGDDGTYSGFNIGGGIEIAAQKNMSAFAEIKYSAMGDGMGRTCFSIGVSYYF